jgi:hypothetical protein
MPGRVFRHAYGDYARVGLELTGLNGIEKYQIPVGPLRFQKRLEESFRYGHSHIRKNASEPSSGMPGRRWDSPN